MKQLLRLLLVCFSASAYAQSSPRFTVARNVIAGGGATFSTSSRFQLAGTVAQPLAATPSSARFAILGGFWIWPSPIIFAPVKTGTNFVFSFQTEPGKTYVVQYTDSLAPPNWQTLPNVSGTGSTASVTNSVAAVTHRYYRLIEQ